jgi:hypothetical protein
MARVILNRSMYAPPRSKPRCCGIRFLSALFPFWLYAAAACSCPDFFLTILGAKQHPGLVALQALHRSSITIRYGGTCSVPSYDERLTPDGFGSQRRVC